VGFVVEKVALGVFFSEYFGFLLSVGESRLLWGGFLKTTIEVRKKA
jgi:hypothetical protein